MKKGISIFLILFFLSHAVYAQGNELLEDAIFSMLFPKINTALEKQYNHIKQYDCPKIVQLKKTYEGTYVFQAEIEIVTYNSTEGNQPKPPFQKVIFDFENEAGDWHIKHMRVEALPNVKVLKCRKPV